MELPAGFDRFVAWKHRRRGTSTPAVTAQNLYTTLINERVSPALRELGLQGSGGRYSIKSDTHWALIGFQKSAFSDRDEVRFTVNLLAVSRTDWANLASERPNHGSKPIAISNYGPPVHTERIGLLVDNHADKWWRISPSQDLDAVGDDVIANLVDAGVPWLRERMAELPS